MAELTALQAAPDFSLQNQFGETITLHQYKGKMVVLYFYPKDNTPTCTNEACEFRDGLETLVNHGAVVLGVSRDSVKSHEKFAEKYKLNFPLLADVTGEVCETYGVLKEKTMFGRTSIGIVRTTFIIDQSGNVAKIFPKVKVAGHVMQVVKAITDL